MNAQPDMTLWLRDIKELFVEREFDPFDEHAIERPGLELIANYIEARSLVRRVQVAVYVPPEQSGEHVRARVEAAMSRYTRRRIEWGQNKIRSSRNDGLRALVYAVVTVLVSLGLYAPSSRPAIRSRRRSPSQCSSSHPGWLFGMQSRRSSSTSSMNDV